MIDLLASVETRRRPSVKDSTQQMREGSRNDGLTRHAGAVRRLGWTESEIRNALKGINETRCVPPLDEKEVDKIAWSVARYEPDQVTQAIVEGWAKEDVEKAVAIPDPGPLDESFCGVPGLIGEVISYNLATAHRPQPVLALAGAIALMGTITGRRITDRLGTRTNIYTMGVAGSGRGKEHARKVNKLLLQLANLDKRIGPEDFGSHAGLICAVSDVPEILFQLDEMGRFMKTANAAGAMPHLSNVITVLLKMFTSSNSLFVGPAYAETNKVKRIEQPHACLYGTTVPESFFAALTTESIKDGFIGRLLAFEAPSDPPELVETATAEDRPPESLIEQLAWWRDYQPGGLLSAGIPRPRMIDDSPDARQQFRDFSADCEKTSATGGVREALWARAHEKARKLALLYAVSESRETSQVSGDAAVWGCQVVRHLTLRMEYLADRHIADGIFDSHGKRVYRLIDDAGPRGLTGTELCRATQAMKPRERSEVLDNLQSAGRVLMATKNGSGRRTHVYVSDRHA
ncbi:MAG: primase C-terminal domain-containing protein [Burkholderiales bacterium]